ncbi:MAG TPA: sulfur oxidation c-type cytochrome SoxX [Limnobacter sp.]|uniref:sulfur oxidation c-type cytochrome SoxX n=1 Tax=Limnobacter sp. TaxID=2003368 RepID=UPI002ED8E588
MRKTVYIALSATGITIAGCAALQSGPEVSNAEVRQELLSSFQDKGQAKLDRVQQTELQEACSVADSGKALPDAKRAAIEKSALAAVKFPADGQYLGDWKSGEKIAQTGTGFQFSDKAGEPAGGNCYACHQLAPQELAYGNIGPSLYNYAKLRGNSEEIMKYTWAKIWNSHAYNACSVMPRFGDAGILTEAQIKDVMALLMSPDSPVNK